MARPKRHYRVAERTKEIENGEVLLTRDSLKNMCLVGLIIYFSTVLLSFTVGYFIGNAD